MDILSHTIAGMVAGSSLGAAYGKGLRQKSMAILAGAGGGALPDIDAISMWSGFDGTFGRLFGLTMSGKEIYSAKLWYSHHGFMHSILAALIIVTVIMLMGYLIGSRKKCSLLIFFKQYQLMGWSFILGFLFHLFGDMITPASAWGGVRIFFPATIYIGGTGSVWWWNNYDLFLILSVMLLFNLGVMGVQSATGKRFRKTIPVIFIAGLIFITVQTARRKYDFNKHTYGENEAYSKTIQRSYLGDNLFRKMTNFDNSLKIHF